MDISIKGLKAGESISITTEEAALHLEFDLWDDDDDPDPGEEHPGTPEYTETNLRAVSNA